MKALFQKIHQFYVEAECSQPMHVGRGEDSSEVLVKHSSGLPFIQGTSIAGAFSSYVEAVYGKEKKEKYFGSSDGENGISGKSALVFSEGKFQTEKLEIEMRTRVRLDGGTGSVKSELLQGTNAKSGQVMDMEYIAKGSSLCFSVYAFDDGRDIARECLAALNRGQIQLGGKNTIGCGKIKLTCVTYRQYDMQKEEGRKAWQNTSVGAEDSRTGTDILEELLRIPVSSINYVIAADMELKTPFLLKANGIDEETAMSVLHRKDEDSLPDVMPLLDGRKDFIIPGSSLKGAFRNRFEMIGNYLGIEPQTVNCVFEDRSDISFEDAVICNAKEEGQAVNQPRIHINKLTGSVMDKSLFWEMTIGGKTSIKITVPKNFSRGAGMDAKAEIGFLLYILRDIHVGAVTLGSGAGIGRGYMKIGNVRIYDGDETQKLAEFAMDNPSQAGKFADSCVKAAASLRKGA